MTNDQHDEIPHNQITLTEATAEQLMNELAGRCLCMAIGYINIKPGVEGSFTTFRYHGNAVTAIGLAVELQADLQRIFRARLTESSEDSFDEFDEPGGEDAD